MFYIGIIYSHHQHQITSYHIQCINKITSVLQFQKPIIIIHNKPTKELKHFEKHSDKMVIENENGKDKKKKELFGEIRLSELKVGLKVCFDHKIRKIYYQISASNIMV